MFQTVVISYSVQRMSYNNPLFNTTFCFYQISLNILDGSVYRGRDDHQALSYTTSYQIGWIIIRVILLLNVFGTYLKQIYVWIKGYKVVGTNKIQQPFNKPVLNPVLACFHSQIQINEDTVLIKSKKQYQFKGTAHTKMIILSLFTHPHVVQTCMSFFLLLNIVKIF